MACLYTHVALAAGYTINHALHCGALGAAPVYHGGGQESGDSRRLLRRG